MQTDNSQKSVWSRRKSELLKELLFNRFVIVCRSQFIEQIKNVHIFLLCVYFISTQTKQFNCSLSCCKNRLCPLTADIIGRFAACHHLQRSALVKNALFATITSVNKQRIEKWISEQCCNSHRVYDDDDDDDVITRSGREGSPTSVQFPSTCGQSNWKIAFHTYIRFLRSVHLWHSPGTVLSDSRSEEISARLVVSTLRAKKGVAIDSVVEMKGWFITWSVVVGAIPTRVWNGDRRVIFYEWNRDLCMISKVQLKLLQFTTSCWMCTSW